MDESWPLFHALDHGNNFFSQEDVLRLALTSPRVVGTLNWIALCRNEDPRPRRAQLPLARPRRPIIFASRAADALCRIAALDENNAAAFRRLATGGVSRGTVVTWGSTTLGRRNDAPIDANFVAVACGLLHSVGLRVDLTVITWGDTTSGQRDDTPTDANFVAVACGDEHSVGLRGDGTVVAWGCNVGHHGDLAPPHDDAKCVTKFVAIACGYEHRVGILSIERDRSVIAP